MNKKYFHYLLFYGRGENGQVMRFIVTLFCAAVFCAHTFLRISANLLKEGTI